VHRKNVVALVCECRDMLFNLLQSVNASGTILFSSSHGGYRARPGFYHARHTNDHRTDSTEEIAEIGHSLSQTMEVVTASRSRTEMRIVSGASAETWVDSDVWKRP
jgi:hypothetical protein